MFAQTGIESTSPTTVPPIDATSSAMWWLIPLAIACLGLIWYLRRLNKLSVQTSGRKDSQKRPTPKAKLVTENEPESSNVDAPIRRVHSSKSSSKKKKKGQGNDQRNAKKSKETQSASSVVTKSVAEPYIVRNQEFNTVSVAEPAMEAKSAEEAQVPLVPPIPVAAIFEPLRSVAPARRRGPSLESQREDVPPRPVSDESVNRPASGGKFERMVPSTAYTRAAANRWPASMTNPVERTVAAKPIETSVESKPAFSKTAVSIPERPQTEVPAAKGLKSFVSKLKTATITDSESDSNAVGTMPDDFKERKEG